MESFNSDSNSDSGASSRSTDRIIDFTGSVKGDYLILRRIGRGGMADVYVAKQTSLDRQVAIKILHSDLASDETYVKRFRREAQSVAQLSHRNIVQVFEVGQWGDQHYIVQEYVDGSNLRQYLDRHGPLSIDMAIAVLIGVVDALQAADGVGITHRDIKPENLMLRIGGMHEPNSLNGEQDIEHLEDVEVKVADFGLARTNAPGAENDLTQVGLTMGTPRYMSPEQVQGKRVNIQSDLYSLGVTMFCLLTGQPPFDAEDPLALAVKHLHDAPPSLRETRGQKDLPGWLVQVVERLLAKLPEDRYENPRALMQVIHQEVSNDSASTVGSTLRHRISTTTGLQRVLKLRSGKTLRSRFHAAMWLLPVGGFLLGGAAAFMFGVPSLSRLLDQARFRPERKASAVAQYLEAARQNDPIAWGSVEQYFPASESQENAEYVVKARLQLGRFHRENRRFFEATRVLERLASNSSHPKLYRALALAELYETLNEERRLDKASRCLKELRSLYNDLVQTAPIALERFKSVVPPSLIPRLQPE